MSEATTRRFKPTRLDMVIKDQEVLAHIERVRRSGGQPLDSINRWLKLGARAEKAALTDIQREE